MPFNTVGKRVWNSGSPSEPVLHLYSCQRVKLIPDLGLSVLIRRGVYSKKMTATVTQSFLGHRKIDNFDIQPAASTTFVAYDDVATDGKDFNLVIDTLKVLKDGGYFSTLKLLGNTSDLSCHALK